MRTSAAMTGLLLATHLVLPTAIAATCTDYAEYLHPGAIELRRPEAETPADRIFTGPEAASHTIADHGSKSRSAPGSFHLRGGWQLRGRFVRWAAVFDPGRVCPPVFWSTSRSGCSRTSR